MGRLTGEVAIVTGASKGIGATIAKALGAAGAAVAVNYASSKEGADRVVGDPGPAEQIRTPRDSKGDRAMKTRSNLLRRIHALSSLTWAMGMMLITAVLAGPAAAQYPPLSEYLMPRDAEIALARSAAPANISGRATIKVLTKSGYEVAHKGDNGFVCMVMRGWTAPTFTPAQLRNLVYVPTYRAPICFDPGASRTVMPYYELRSKLGMESKTPDQIAEDLQAAYDKGKLPRRDGVSFAYMWSADQNLGPEYGHWHPHMMVFTPYYDNSMLGDNEFGSPLPQVTDDAGTPFTVVVIPVDHKLAIKAQAR